MKNLFITAIVAISINSLAQEIPSGEKIDQANKPDHVINDQTLRKRQHILQFDYSQSSSQLITSSTTNSTSFNLQGTYGYNIGHLEPFVGFSSSSEENMSNGDKTNVSTSVFGIRYNFIENRPGNDLIPFASFGLLSSTVDSVDSGSSTSVSGNGTALAAGISWYPFSEIFAVNFGVVSSHLSVSGATFSGDSRSTSVLVGYMISF